MSLSKRIKLSCTEKTWDLMDLPVINDMLQLQIDQTDQLNCFEYPLNKNYTLLGVANMILGFLNFGTVGNVEDLIQAANFLGAINEHTVSKFQIFLQPQTNCDRPGWNVIYEHRDCNDACFAATHGHVICLRRSIEMGFSIMDKFLSNCAAEKGQIQCLQYLFENKCPMHSDVVAIAAENGHFTCVKYLVENKCSFNEDAICRTLETGHFECLKYLLEKYLEAECPMSSTPIELAIKNDLFECFKYLIEKKCPMSEFAIYIAIRNPRFDFFKILVENNCPFDNFSISFAIDYENVECLDYLIKKTRTFWGVQDEELALEHVIKRNSVKCLKCLVDNNYDMEGAIAHAAMYNSLDCLSYLMNLGLPVDRWAISQAALHGNLECLECLIKNGYPMCSLAVDEAVIGCAVCDVCDLVDGEEKCYKMDCLKLLVENNCPMSARAVNIAIKYRKFDCLAFLVKNNCPITNTRAVKRAIDGVLKSPAHPQI